MDEILRQDREEAYESVKPSIPKRKGEILSCLSNGEEMTVTEILEELVHRGVLIFPDRNYVAPRLSEMREDGLVEVVGHRPSRTGRNEAIWKLIEQKEK